MRTAAPLLGKGKCSKSYAGGDVQLEFICIYHLPSRREDTAAASHLPRAPGWASINNWGLDRAGRSAPAGSHSLVAGRRRRGLTEPLGRGGGICVEDRPKLDFSPSASAPSSPGCSAARVFATDARRHTRPADWAESKIWADWSGSAALLKGPFFTSSALALPPLPHPLPHHISAQAIVLVLCSPLCSFA